MQWINDYRAVDQKRKLDRAFRLMRKHGLIARQDWKCCQTCGLAATDEGKSKRRLGK